MRLSRPFASVCPGPRGAVLTVLARTESPLTGRTVASLVSPHASLRTVQLALDDLVAHGLIRRELAGNAHLYTLNREHLAAPAVIALVGLREEFFDRVRSTVGAWPEPVEAVWLFGSVARGEEDPDSDIDLLVVRSDRTDGDDPVWQRQLTDLAEQVHRWTGNSCEILELSHAELDAAVARGDRLSNDLRRDAVHIAGRSPREALQRRVT
jgi:predicted nucleotidyltransferase